MRIKLKRFTISAGGGGRGWCCEFFHLSIWQIVWPDVEWDFQLSSLQPRKIDRSIFLDPPTSHQTLIILLLSWPIAWPSCQIFLSLLIYLSDFTARGLMSRSDDFTIPTWILPSCEFLTVSPLITTFVFNPSYTENTRRWLNDGLMLGQRRRRWANIDPALSQRLVFAGWY